MQPCDIATGPENLPLASQESRAAARLMLKRIQADREKHVIRITVEHIGSTEPNHTFKVYAQTKRENR
jgi:hypothetical protein